MDAESIAKRVAKLTKLADSKPLTHADFGELRQGTANLLATVYGPESTQLRTLEEMLGSMQKRTMGEWIESQEGILADVMQGSLRNLEHEVKSGLIGNLQRQITADVLTDFVRLARAILEEKGIAGTNVAAVLAAAAFEDTIRRMATTLASASGDEDLSDLLARLKVAGVIQSPQIGIAQSYLAFRNHALHANWDKIALESVHSILGFVEQLLLKHFQ